jgi:hypothetical protein
MMDILVLIVYCLFPSAILLVIFLLIKVFFSKRYKSPSAKKISAGVLVSSLLLAGIYYKVGIADFHNNESEYVNPAIEWQKADLLQAPALSLEYQSGIGLFAVTGSGDIQLTAPVPYCLVENQSSEIFPEKVEITNNPFAELPEPPQVVKQQVIFDINYAVKYDVHALSSYVILDNGEVWCTERIFRGPADFPKAVTLEMGYVITAIFVFLGSLISLLAITIVVFEIYRWRKEKMSV